MFPILLRVPVLWTFSIAGADYSIGGFSVATYGLLVALAYLTGIVWLKSQMKPMSLSENKFWGLIYSIFAGAIVGGKILYVLLNWDLYASGQMGLIRDFRYGFVFYGGFAGAVISGGIYIYASGLSFRKMADFFGVALPLGHWIGRLGCLAAGCCYGRETDGAWGIRFTDPNSLVPANLRGRPLHPTQIYEAVGDIVIAFMLYEMLQKVRAGRLKRGTVFLSYIILYAALRFAVEIFRGDDRGGFLLNLSPSQWFAAAALAAAAGAMRFNGLWAKKST